MKRRLAAVLAMLGGLGGLATATVRAQTHVVKKPETVVRAIAVYEWTGDEAKPTGSRLVPVSIFINSQLEDAGVYMARPVPFALDLGTVFEVQKSGVAEGTLELAYQRHLEGTGAISFDDGWLGYGRFKPAAAEPVVVAAKKAGPLPQVVASGGSGPHLAGATGSAAPNDSNRPVLQKRGDSTDSSSTGSSTSAPSSTSSANDPNRPVLQKRTDSTDSGTGSGTASTTASSGSSNDPNRPVLQKRSDSTDTASTSSGSSDSTAAATTTPAPASAGSSTASSGSSSADDDDPHRPVLQRRQDSSDPGPTTSSSGGSGSGSSRGGGSTSSDSTDDADRPTLKKRPATQAKSSQRKGDQASVESVGSLNDDPDRPTLHRGTVEAPAIPPLNGLPADMRQMVAVSDAKDRPEHDFTRQWESADERYDTLAKMQEMARTRLAKYDMPAPAAAPAPAPASTKTSAKAKKTPAAPPAPPAPVELSDESLRGYTLSYGGAATFVYCASSPGTAGATRYVTVVAQREPQGELKVALSSVTDTTHLDRTPWMRLVDVVDAEASNRASLLFELRANNVRQFALYRVISAQAELIFQTGTTE